MATPTFTQEDNLAHIEYQPEIKADDPGLLRNQVSSTNGQIVVVSAFASSLVLDYAFSREDLRVTLVLQTPVGSKTMIDTNLHPSQPSKSMFGAVNSFKALGTVSFDFANNQLAASGEVCAPFLGCKSGGVSINV